MNQFFKYLRERSRKEFRLNEEEHATIDAVVRRIRNAIEKGKGIRLNKDELRVLGLYGLKKNVETDPPPWESES